MQTLVARPVDVNEVAADEDDDDGDEGILSCVTGAIALAAQLLYLTRTMLRAVRSVARRRRTSTAVVSPKCEHATKRACRVNIAPGGIRERTRRWAQRHRRIR